MSIPNIFGYSFIPQKNYSEFTAMAYDLVDHQILVQKLEAIVLNPNSTNLMKSYLENRQ